MSKRPRTIDGFFGTPATKKARADDDNGADNAGTDNATDSYGEDAHIISFSIHPSYPFDIKHLPRKLNDTLSLGPAAEGVLINNEPDLDLLYFQPFVSKNSALKLSEFLKQALFFYRVKYPIKRGSVETVINTPRFTTVFGVDETSRFDQDNNLIDAASGKLLPPNTYKCKPRPIPQCLDLLQRVTERATDCKFNFVLVNYYANGNDSISYHSDDERFLGPNPAIASFSFGAERDFLLKHKPTPNKHPSEVKPMKLPLASGDMVLMRGKTQSNWLHSIPKRKGGEADKGRINITFRRALVRGGTENYYRYNVGDGAAHRWDLSRHEMVAQQADGAALNKALLDASRTSERSAG